MNKKIGFAVAVFSGLQRISDFSVAVGL